MTDEPEYDPVERVEHEDRSRFAWKLVFFIVLLMAGLVAQRRYEKWIAPPQLSFTPSLPPCMQMPCPYVNEGLGIISGTPTREGMVTLTITSASPLPDGVQGAPYTIQLQSVGAR